MAATTVPSSAAVSVAKPAEGKHDSLILEVDGEIRGDRAQTAAVNDTLDQNSTCMDPHTTEGRVRLQRRRLQNSEVAVNRLPPELLSAIFRILAERNPSPMFFPLEPCIDIWDGTPRWLYATEVCTHWRTVAINDPALWNKLDLQFLQYSPYHLQWLGRSKGAPLDVCVDCMTVDEDILSEVVSRSGQLRDLQLSYLPDVVTKFSEAVPMLRRLSVEGSSGDCLPRLFQGYAPLLAALELTNLLKISPQNKFSNIQRLVIRAEENWSQSEYTDFLVLLCSLPRLRDLEMRCLGGPDEDEEESGTLISHDHTMTDLPFLRRIDIHDWHVSWPCALFHLDSLPKKNLALTMHDCWPFHAFHNNATLFSWAQAKTSRPCPDATRMDIDFTPLSVCAASARSSVTSRFMTCEDPDYRQHRDPSGLSGIAQVIMSYDLRELWLAGFSLNPDREWPVIFAALRSLDKLVLEIGVFDPPGPWIEALFPEDAPGDESYPAPVLRELWMSPLDYDPEDAFVDYLARRRDSGHGIHTLRILYAPAESPTRNSRFERMFRRWEKEIRQELERSVEALEFETFPHHYPRMTLPDQ